MSLQEIVGSLAVIALLAAMLIPRIIPVIDDSELAAEAKSINTLATATQAYYEKYGVFGGLQGASIGSWNHNAYENWDRNVLLAEGFLEAPLKSRLATNAYVRLVKVSVTSSNTAILTDVGQVGHLGGFNGNNGYYNLTAQYAANAGQNPDGTAYARASGKSRLSPLGMVVGPLLRAGRSPGAGPLLDGSATGWIRGGFRLPGFRATPGNQSVWTWLSRRLLKARETGVGPLQCCYPVPTTWVAPTAGIGGGDIGSVSNPAHSDPGAKTQVLAVNASSPAIVAELVLEGISVEDAYKLSLSIDGRIQSNWAFFDSLGRVKYDMYNGGGGSKSGVVMIYLAHK